MKKATVIYIGAITIGIALFMASSHVRLSALPLPADVVSIDNNDIGGVVTSSKGPEAGVWVIAETTDLPTRYIKTVVTDDRGRYLVPDLPKANYKVWVRGYGLVDSQAIQSAPGKVVNLTAVIAPSARAAAEYYPAVYWFSLLHVPEKSEFPGTGPSGNGINPNMKSQAEWLTHMKTYYCVQCHVMGDQPTRHIPDGYRNLGSSAAAWERRLQSGQAGASMTNGLAQFGKDRALKMFSDWTDRIAAGEVPPTPPRPQGVERNVVVTQWDWANPKVYLHDEISTDRRNPTINGYGLIYGAPELSADYMPVLDPVRNTVTQIPLPLRDPSTTSPADMKLLRPSRHWGEELLWQSKSNAHNTLFDQKSRVWVTTRIRPGSNPAFCKEGSDHPSAKLFPLANSNRQLAIYDPKTKKFTLIDTCYTTHHLLFSEDANNTLWTSSAGGTQAIGWFNSAMFDKTGDEQKSQGWAPLIVDTNGNGKQDAWVEPDAPVDPAKDKRIAPGLYAIAPSPVDSSIWGGVMGFPGFIIRFVPGANPPQTSLTEIYELPWNNPKAPVQGYGPRGMDIDRNGVVWTGIASGHMASFDRRKCKGPLNGPSAMGQHCPEGWTLYPFPGPQFKNLSDSGSAEAAYYNWVDQFGTLGLGNNVPVATGNENEGLLALLPDTGKFVNLRVPYPMGFFAKGLDGRIDDPKAGWKGRGIWTTWGMRTPFHAEGGKTQCAKGFAVSGSARSAGEVSQEN